MNNYVIGIGEALFDCFDDTAKLGGAPANFAYHAGQFGLKGCVISAIGDDPLGKTIEKDFTQIGLEYELPVVEQATGRVKVTLDENRQPQYEICLGVAWDNIPLTNRMLEIAHHAKAICFGTLAQRSPKSRETIRTLIDAAPESALRVYDINLRQYWYTKEIIEDSLSRADVLKINDDELDVVAPMLLGVPVEKGRRIAEDPVEAGWVCRELIAKYGLNMLILTCGAVGSYVFTAKEESYIPTPKVLVADPVGAGDSFTATFVAQTLLGKPMRDAHRKAVEVSAFVCTQHGAMPAIPEELK